MIDIFIKSYAKDFDYLYLYLKSVKKYAIGYGNLYLVIPEKDKYIFDHSDLPERTHVHYSNDYGNGYLYQQFIKLSAHNYSVADFILFSDSDCVFYKPVDLSKVVTDNKPDMLYTDYSLVGNAICWKECTEMFIGEPQQYEFMRRLPLIYHRSTIESVFLMYKNTERLIMQSDRFSEFNVLGAYAFKNEKDKYNLINTDTWQYEEPITKQFKNMPDEQTRINDLIEIRRILQ